MSTQDGLWENLLKRLRQVARKHRDGHGPCAAVLTVVLVLEGDQLKGWLNPEVQRFEPVSARRDLMKLILQSGNGEPLDKTGET